MKREARERDGEWGERERGNREVMRVRMKRGGRRRDREGGREIEGSRGREREKERERK